MAEIGLRQSEAEKHMEPAYMILGEARRISPRASEGCWAHDTLRFGLLVSRITVNLVFCLQSVVFVMGSLDN